jgi:hypothetical protein
MTELETLVILGYNDGNVVPISETVFCVEHVLEMFHLRIFNGIMPQTRLRSLLGCEECPAYKDRLYEKSRLNTNTLIGTEPGILSETTIHCWLTVRQNLDGIEVPCQVSFANINLVRVELPFLEQLKLAEVLGI